MNKQLNGSMWGIQIEVIEGVAPPTWEYYLYVVLTHYLDPLWHRKFRASTIGSDLYPYIYMTLVVLWD